MKAETIAQLLLQFGPGLVKEFVTIWKAEASGTPATPDQFLSILADINSTSVDSAVAVAEKRIG